MGAALLAGEQRRQELVGEPGRRGEAQQERRAVRALLQAVVGEGAVVEPAAEDGEQHVRAVEHSFGREVGRGADYLPGERRC